MTVPVQQIRYVYSGPIHQADIIPIPFEFKEDEFVKAAMDNTDWEINIDYAVSGSNLIVTTEVPEGSTLTVYRKTDMEQDSDYPQSAAFDSDKIEDALDKLTMQNQEQEDALGRCLQQPINSDPESAGITIGEIIPKHATMWDETGTQLVSTEYDLEQMAADAHDATLDARAAITLAEQAVGMAQSAAGDAADAAHDVAQASSTILGVAETARNYAIGTIAECPEGSAKWWAQQTAQTVQGSYYTKNETDALVAAKADNFTPKSPLEFVTEDNTKKLQINDTTLSGTYATKSFVTGITDTKQDTLIPSTGVSIAADGKTISVDITSVAYTKAQVDSLVEAKQNTLTAGSYINISSDTISVAADTLIQGFTENQWSDLSTSEKQAIKLAVIYE